MAKVFQRKRLFSRVVALAPTFLYVAGLPPLTWEPTYPDRVRATSPHAALAPQPVLGQPPIVPPTTIYGFYPEYPDSAPRSIRVPEGWTVEPLQEPANIARDQGWQPEFPEQVRRAPAPVGEGFYTQPTQEPPDIATRMRWKPEFPDSARRAPRPPDAGWFTKPLNEPPDIAPQQGWAPEFPDSARRAPAVPASHYTYPVLSPAPAVVVTGWSPSYPDSVRRAPQAAEWFVEPLVDFSVIAQFRWQPEFPVVMRRAPATYPGWFTQSPADFTAIITFRWEPEFPSSVRRAPAPVAVGWFSRPILPPVVVAVPPLSWTPSYPVSVRRAPRADQGWFVKPHLPPVAEDPNIAIQMRWGADYPGEVRRRTTVPFTWFTRSTTTVLPEPAAHVINVRGSSTTTDLKGNSLTHNPSGSDESLRLLTGNTQFEPTP